MKAKVAVIGIGNATSVFVQGLRFYSSGGRRGLWHERVAGLRPEDVEVTAAFDVDPRKVGLDLSEAMFAKPNVARRYLNVPKLGVTVFRGIERGDAPPHLRGMRLASSSPRQVSKRLEESKADVVVNLASSGTDHSSESYARAALAAGCSFVNCTPSMLTKKRSLASAFRKAGLLLVGDDLMSQFGGTVFHKGLLNLLVRRGIHLSRSYQLDVGGGSETFNTVDETIKAAKRSVKTGSVAFEVPYKFETVAGTTDYVDYMGNDRTSYFWFEGEGFLDTGISVDIYLRTSDGANAGNILLDVIRATRSAARRGGQAAVDEICGYGFKSPPRPEHYEEAYTRFVSRFVK